MKKVIIDSSSWVSYFIGLRKNAPICQKITQVIEDADEVLLPDIIYAEVLNVLTRLGCDSEEIAEVKNFFQARNFIKYCHDYDFWFKKLEFYMKKVTLETHDLVILASTFEKRPCELYTGDKKLSEAYITLKNYYESSEN